MINNPTAVSPAGGILRRGQNMPFRYPFLIHLYAREVALIRKSIICLKNRNMKDGREYQTLNKG